MIEPTHRIRLLEKVAEKTAAVHTFSPAMDKSPALKGKQSKLPDSVQAAIIKKKAPPKVKVSGIVDGTATAIGATGKGLSKLLGSFSGATHGAAKTEAARRAAQLAAAESKASGFLGRMGLGPNKKVLEILSKRSADAEKAARTAKHGKWLTRGSVLGGGGALYAGSQNSGGGGGGAPQGMADEQYKFGSIKYPESSQPRAKNTPPASASSGRIPAKQVVVPTPSKLGPPPPKPLKLPDGGIHVKAKPLVKPIVDNPKLAAVHKDYGRDAGVGAGSGALLGALLGGSAKETVAQGAAKGGGWKYTITKGLTPRRRLLLGALGAGAGAAVGSTYNKYKKGGRLDKKRAAHAIKKLTDKTAGVTPEALDRISRNSWLDKVAAPSYPIGQGPYHGAGKLPPTSTKSPDGGPRVTVKIPGGKHTLPPQMSQDFRRVHPSNKKGTEWPELVNQKAVQDLSQDMTAYKKRDAAADKVYQAGKKKRDAQEAYRGDKAAARIKALPDGHQVGPRLTQAQQDPMRNATTEQRMRTSPPVPAGS